MKLTNIAFILSSILSTSWGFTPSSSSSFTQSFSIQTQKSQHQIQLHQSHKIDKMVYSSRRQNGKSGTEMKMMFDQLANAITEVTRDIGGRKK